jgi:ubiquinone biosynthesis protein UbiJ
VDRQQEKVSPHHVEQLAKEVAKLSAMLAALDKRLAVLEKSTPPHMQGIERRAGNNW